MIRTRRTRNLLLTLALTAVVTTAGGAAYAYWTSGATGSGGGATGSLSAITLTPGTPGANLYPGAQTDVVLTATNPNTQTTRIASLVLDTAQGTGGFAVDGGHPGCSVAALGYSTQTNGGAGWTVPARVGLVDGTLPITLANALTMAASAAGACQGATFTVYLRAAA
jgi:hypothetical protein